MVPPQVFGHACPDIPMTASAGAGSRRQQWQRNAAVDASPVAHPGGLCEQRSGAAMPDAAAPATPYVFLSYASADGDRALVIADLLEGQGSAAWIDQHSGLATDGRLPAC